MNFTQEKPIYLQIADVISERILRGEFPPEGRITSVREYSAELGVNPNTMMRTYESLTDGGIIYNKRGIGYFVTPEARQTILSAERKVFLEKEVPAILKRMELLGVGPEVFNG